MMQRLFPAPRLSLVLTLTWLALNGSLSLGQTLLGLLFGFAAPALLAPLRPARTRLGRYDAMLRLSLRVSIDGLRSCWLVLVSLRGSAAPTRFITVPLDIRSNAGLAALAVVTTMVPGTVWCELARDGSRLLLHVWDPPADDASFITHYKQTYEQPLMEIFQS